MSALELLKAGHDYKGVKSILESYCAVCLEPVPENKGVWTNFGLECNKCSAP